MRCCSITSRTCNRIQITSPFTANQVFGGDRWQESLQRIPEITCRIHGAHQIIIAANNAGSVSDAHRVFCGRLPEVCSGNGSKLKSCLGEFPAVDIGKSGSYGYHKTADRFTDLVISAARKAAVGLHFLPSSSTVLPGSMSVVPFGPQTGMCISHQHHALLRYVKYGTAGRSYHGWTSFTFSDLVAGAGGKTIQCRRVNRCWYLFHDSGFRFNTVLLKVR